MNRPDSIGPYRLLEKLGQGGMGVVYKGRHEQIERRVAIKILNRRPVGDPEFQMRFLNEARAANRVTHPGLVQITDAGITETGDAFLVMEFLDGETLHRRLSRTACSLPIVDSLRIARLVAGALVAAHDGGIVHRDLKPENIMLVPDPDMPDGERTKLMDFGIAKLQSIVQPDGDETQTKSGVPMGTAEYMAPEQCRSAKKADAKADVYALGVILYQMLSGKVPFTGEGAGDIYVKHMKASPPSLALLVPSLPVALTRLVHRMLEKTPNARPSMAEVHEELRKLSEPMMAATHAGHPKPAASTLTGGAMPRAHAAHRPPAPPAALRGLYVADVLALLMLLASMASTAYFRSPKVETKAVVVASQDRKPPPPTPDARAALPKPVESAFPNPDTHAAPPKPTGPAPPVAGAAKRALRSKPPARFDEKGFSTDSDRRFGSGPPPPGHAKPLKLPHEKWVNPSHSISAE